MYVKLPKNAPSNPEDLKLSMMFPYRGRIFNFIFVPVFWERYSIKGSYRSICLKMFCSGIRPISSFFAGGFFAGAGGSCGEQAAKSGRHSRKRMHATDRFRIATFYMKSRNDGKNGMRLLLPRVYGLARAPSPGGFHRHRPAVSSVERSCPASSHVTVTRYRIS